MYQGNHELNRSPQKRTDEGEGGGVARRRVPARGGGDPSGSVVVALCLCAPILPSSAQGQFAQWRDVMGGELISALGNADNLADGEPFVTALPVRDASDVGLAGVIRAAVPAPRCVGAASVIEPFDRGGSGGAPHRLGAEPSAADFASLAVSPLDLSTLRTCREGRCAIKLDGNTIQQLAREIEWSSPTATGEANAIVRQFVLGLVRSYLQHGDSGLPVYLDKDRPIAAADEFASILRQASELGPQADALRRYFAEFPRAPLPTGATSLLYWQLVDFGLKPVLRVSHLVVWPRGSVTIVTSRLLYASHYFWSALETRFLIADQTRSDSCYVVTVERSRSDGLTGFTGTLIGGTVRSHARQALIDALGALRLRLVSAL